MKKKLYSWQDNAFTRFVKKLFFALVCDCGCGKTLAAIRIAIAKALPTVIIAPGHALCEQWKHDVLDEMPDADVWVYNRNDETKRGAAYVEDFKKWLTR
jgi:superfamily II DNA or RNA helicase